MHSTCNLEKSSLFFFFLVAYCVNCSNKFAVYCRSLSSSLHSLFPLFFYGARWIATGSTNGCYWLHLWLVNFPNDQVYLSCLFGKEILRLSSGKMPTILKIVSWNYDFLVCMAMLFTSLLSILSWIVTSIFGPLLCIIVSPLFSITLNMWSVIMVETCSVAIHAVIF